MTLLDDLNRELTEFLDGRTVGFDLSMHETGFFWRGPGYDEGWEAVTPEELNTLLGLLTAIREMRRRMEPPPPAVTESVRGLTWSEICENPR